MTRESLKQQLDGIVPKNPKSDWSTYQRNIIDRAIRTLDTDRDALDKIRTEIENCNIHGHIRDVECFYAGVRHALTIIDKYKAKK